MKTLAIFYLKASLFSIIKILGLGLSALIVFKFIPLVDPVDKEDFFRFVIIYFLPFIYFLGKKNLIAYSINWILQTPIKKLDIVLVNGLVNFVKIILYLIAADTLLYLYSFDTQKMLISNIIRYSSIILKTDHSTSSIFLLIFLFMAFLIVCFTIIKPRSQRTREDYQIPSLKMDLETLKIFGMILIVLLIGGALGPLVVEYLPSLLLVAIFFAFILTAATAATLRAINHSMFSLENNFKMFLITTFVFSGLLVLSAHRDIHSTTFSLKKKVNAQQLLGSHLFNTQDIIIHDFKTVHKSLRGTSNSDLKALMEDLPAITKRDIHVIWVKSCLEKKDFSCELATQTREKNEVNPTREELLRTSCPNELRSCFMLAIETKNKEESESLFDKVKSECADRIKEENKIVCKEFELYRSKYEESKTKASL